MDGEEFGKHAVEEGEDNYLQQVGGETEFIN